MPEVDDLVAVMMPVDFAGVGQWCADFSQTTDDELRERQQSASAPTGPG
jgi:predicted phosphoribosyltransferase